MLGFEYNLEPRMPLNLKEKIKIQNGLANKIKGFNALRMLWFYCNININFYHYGMILNDLMITK